MNTLYEKQQKRFNELDAQAQKLYDNDDFEGFYNFSDEDLARLWSMCIITQDNISGRAYDDEVYDAITSRENANEIFNNAKKYIEIKNEAIDEEAEETPKFNLPLEEDIDSSYYDADAIVNVYVANLGKYNEGELVGGWIGLPTEDIIIEKFLTDVVKLDDEYEEYALHDWESEYLEYPGEYANIYEINEQASQINELDEFDMEVFKAAEEAGMVDDITDFHADDYLYLSGVDNNSDLAYEYLDSLYGGDLSYVSDSTNYIDFDALRRDIELESYEEDNFREEYEYENGEDYDEDDFQDAFSQYLDSLMDEIEYSPTEYLSSESIERYFDYDAFGRDLSIDGTFTENGFIFNT